MSDNTGAEIRLVSLRNKVTVACSGDYDEEPIAEKLLSIPSKPLNRSGKLTALGWN